MAEQNVADLPVITESEFTVNDRFLIVDDGKVRLLTKGVFESWLANNVQGVQGEQGVAGKDGVNGSRGADGVNGKDGLSAYQLFVNSGFVGDLNTWKLSLKGAKGDKGDDGTNGWTPLIKTVPNGSGVSLQITEWVGGTGTPPASLGYIGDTGIVANLANATNIKGTKGDTGAKGETGKDGAKGADGIGSKVISDVTINPDSSLKLTYTDATSISSNTPERVTGWGTYKDSQYTQASPFTVATGTQISVPNDGTTKEENLPKGYTRLFNPATQKYLMQEADGYYSVRVKFKVVESTPASFINVSMNGGTSDILYSEDRVLRGDSQTQALSFSTEIYGGTALASNGLSINVKTYDRAVSIYSIEVTIAKLI